LEAGGHVFVCVRVRREVGGAGERQLCYCLVVICAKVCLQGGGEMAGRIVRFTPNGLSVIVRHLHITQR
jgi:hypothetical protein